MQTRAAAGISVGDERIGQGRDNAKQYIADHPELAAELEARVRAHLMEVQNSRIKQPAAPAESPWMFLLTTLTPNNASACH